MTELIYNDFCSGKCIMQEIEWQNLKCRSCGAEMPKYPQHDKNKIEIKTCPKCGKSVVLVRHIKTDIE